jgi:DNA-binding protein Fis
MEHFTAADKKQDMTLDELERSYVMEILTRCGGNRTKASRILGITLRGLQYKLKRWENAE